MQEAKLERIEWEGSVKLDQPEVDISNGDKALQQISRN